MSSSLVNRARNNRIHKSLSARFGESYVIHGLAILAGIVEITWLSLRSIPEVLPFGEELGLVSSQLSMSYIAAYLFRILLITGPEKRNQRRARSAFMCPLHMIANDGEDLIAELEFIGRVTETRPISSEYLAELCDYVDWKSTVRIAERLDEVSKTWDKVLPNIYLFEPELILLLRGVEAANFRKFINLEVFHDYTEGQQVIGYARTRDYVLNLADRTKTRMTIKPWGSFLEQYLIATRALKTYLESAIFEERYIDGKMGHWTSMEFVSSGQEAFVSLSQRIDENVAPDGGPLDSEPIPY